MSSYLKPNFFIIGAPKCGTTAMSIYLGEHQDIFISDPKEPHYFSKDLPNYSQIKSLTEYEKLFDRAIHNESVVGEASVQYLCSKEAIKNIYNYNPNSKILILLRDPVEFLYSYHNQMVNNLDEKVYEFSKAWEMHQKDPHKHIEISNPREPYLLNYSEMVKFDEQIERVYNHFPKDQVFIGLLEELKSNPVDLYQRILQFLDVPYDNRTEFPVINANQEISNTFINTIKYSKLFDLLRGLKNKLGLKNHKLMSWFYNKAYKKKKRERLDEKVENSIRKEITPMVKRLEVIMNQDLSNWKIQ